MAANLDAALQEAIRSGVLEMNVEIEFSVLPAAAQLEALGLKSEGHLAWGILSRDKVQAIASFPQVAAMRLSKRPAERRMEMGHRIGPRLTVAMQAKPQDKFDVLVRFRRPPEPPLQIEGFYIEQRSGKGLLSKQQIETLASHDDVLEIDLVPKMKLL